MAARRLPRGFLPNLCFVIRQRPASHPPHSFLAPDRSMSSKHHICAVWSLARASLVLAVTAIVASLSAGTAHVFPLSEVLAPAGVSTGCHGAHSAAPALTDAQRKYIPVFQSTVYHLIVHTKINGSWNMAADEPTMREWATLGSAFSGWKVTPIILYGPARGSKSTMANGMVDALHWQSRACDAPWNFTLPRFTTGPGHKAVTHGVSAIIVADPYTQTLYVTIDLEGAGLNDVDHVALQGAIAMIAARVLITPVGLSQHANTKSFLDEMNSVSESNSMLSHALNSSNLTLCASSNATCKLPFVPALVENNVTDPERVFRERFHEVQGTSADLARKHIYNHYVVAPVALVVPKLESAPPTSCINGSSFSIHPYCTAIMAQILRCDFQAVLNPPSGRMLAQDYFPTSAHVITHGVNSGINVATQRLCAINAADWQRHAPIGAPQLLARAKHVAAGAVTCMPVQDAVATCNAAPLAPCDGSIITACASHAEVIHAQQTWCTSADETLLDHIMNYESVAQATMKAVEVALTSTAPTSPLHLRIAGVEGVAATMHKMVAPQERKRASDIMVLLRFAPHAAILSFNQSQQDLLRITTKAVHAVQLVANDTINAVSSVSVRFEPDATFQAVQAAVQRETAIPNSVMLVWNKYDRSFNGRLNKARAAVSRRIHDSIHTCSNLVEPDLQASAQICSWSKANVTAWRNYLSHGACRYMSTDWAHAAQLQMNKHITRCNQQCVSHETTKITNQRREVCTGTFGRDEKGHHWSDIKNINNPRRWTECRELQGGHAWELLPGWTPNWGDVVGDETSYEHYGPVVSQVCIRCVAKSHDRSAKAFANVCKIAARVISHVERDDINVQCSRKYPALT